MANNTSRRNGDYGWNPQGEQRRGGRREWERGKNDNERSGYDYGEGYGRGYGTYNYEEEYNRDYGYSTGEASGYNTYGGAYGGANRQRGGGQQRGQHHGRGPQGYQRSDERIQDDINDRLTWHGDVDATHITVTVSSGEVTLEGRVSDRRQKRIAEDVAEGVNGVKDVHNRLKVDQSLNEQGG